MVWAATDLLSERTHVAESLKFLRKIVLKKDGIRPKFDRAKRHSSIDMCELIDTSWTFPHMIEIGRQHLVIGALRTFELFSWRNLHWRLTSNICHQKIHCYILAIHSAIDQLANDGRHSICIHVIPVFVMESSSC